MVICLHQRYNEELKIFDIFAHKCIIVSNIVELANPFVNLIPYILQYNLMKV